MRIYSVGTDEYSADIPNLLRRRLDRSGLDSVPLVCDNDHGQSFVTLEIGEDELDPFASAVCELMLVDLRYFELCSMAEQLSLSPEGRQCVMRLAAERSLSGLELTLEKEELMDYLKENDTLILDGYLRFRMQHICSGWKDLIDEAAEIYVLGEELAELSSILDAFEPENAVDRGGDPSCEVTVVLNPDGSCTLINGPACGNGTRIDCAPGSTAGVISMLKGMRPGRVSVFDFSFGKCGELRSGIEKLFGLVLKDDDS